MTLYLFSKDETEGGARRLPLWACGLAGSVS